MSAPVALLAAAAACAALLSCSSTDTPSGPPEKLTIAEASQPVFALVYVAEARGYFRQAGLEVTFTSFRLGRDALDSVIEGKADVATVYDTPAVIRLCEGEPLGILSTLHTSTQNSSVVARRDRGIASPADLKGKRIGVTKGTSAEYFISVFLATEGIPADSVTIVPVEPAGLRDAIVGTRVDALSVFMPYSGMVLEALGSNGIAFHSDAYVETSMLVGLRATIAAKPEAMTRLMRAIVRAQDFIEHDRQEAIAIVARRLAGKFDEKLIRDAWVNFTPVARMDHVTLTLLRQEAEWFRETGKFNTLPPDMRPAMLPQYLGAARADVVTLAPLPARK
jgi:NitT/TauT family transport system substrate-binding protein